MEKYFKGTLNDLCKYFLDMFEYEEKMAKENKETSVLSSKVGIPVKTPDTNIILPKTIHIVIDDISEEACRKIASAVNRYIKNY